MIPRINGANGVFNESVSREEAVFVGLLDD